MSDSTTILSHIISITESRDMEILEISLLRTIFEIVECRNVYLVKIDQENPGILGISGYGDGGYRDQCDMEMFPELNLFTASIKSFINGDSVQSVHTDNTDFLIIPVDVLKSRIGFIIISVHPASAVDMNVLEGLVRIYRNYVSILLDNQTDTLTGILNRKTFDDRILRLIDIKKREKNITSIPGHERRAVSDERFWLGIFDIDDFKKVNDTFGHIYGDEILILVSRIMQNVFRSSDMKFRFGGEEFIIVMRAEDSSAAYSVFERFRRDVENYRFPQTGKITVSIGIVEITGEETPSVFVGCADKALYYAKEHGKNMTCVYADLVKKGLIEPEASRKGEVILF